MREQYKGIEIDPTSYHTNPMHREIADRAMTAYGLDPNTVTLMRITESWVYVERRTLKPICEQWAEVYPLPGGRK